MTTPLSPSAPTRARRLTLPLYLACFFEEFVLLYPFYALWFTDHGLSVGQVTSLFALWSVAGLCLEVPSGALADRLPRRWLLAAAPVLSAAAFTLWLVWPGYWVFAAGFVLWGAAGALSSGALEALVYTELGRRGAAGRYARVMGAAQACGVVAVGVSTVVAVPVAAWGGYRAVGAASVAACLVAAAAAWSLPEGPRAEPGGGGGEDGDGYLAVLRAGVGEVLASRVLLGAAALVAALPAVWESLEEFVPLLAAAHGVGAVSVPWVVAAVWAGVAAGGLLAGRTAGLPARVLGAGTAAAGVAAAVGALWGAAPGWVLLAAAFGWLQAASVVADARLQEAMSGARRATVTSVAGLGSEVAALAVLAGYAGVFPAAGHAGAFAVLAALYLLVGAAWWRCGGRGRR